MSEGESTLEVAGVSKSFGLLPVLRGINLSFASAERVLLLGANGAGKSTLLRILAGVTRPDRGTSKNRSPRPVGFFSQYLSLYSKLQVRENLRLFAAFGEVEDVEAHLAHWGLLPVAHKLISELSRGNQARVALARAFLHKPSLLLLDEPSSHLDEGGVALLRAAIERGGIQEHLNTTTLLATHDLHRLGGLATRVVVLTKGTVTADTGPAASAEAMREVIDIYRESNR